MPSTINRGDTMKHSIRRLSALGHKVYGQLERLALTTALMTCLIFSSATYAQDCGSGWNRPFVPDRIPLLNCEFVESCRRHDDCYSRCEGKTTGECAYRRCLPGGDLKAAKSKLCESVTMRQLAFDAASRRKSCDTNFYTDLTQKNPARPACQVVAIVYRDAVRRFGEASFLGFEPGQRPTALQQSENEYNEAIAAFLGSATDADFQTFLDRYSDPLRKTNLCGRLAYSAKTGLANVSDDDRRSPCP